MVGGKKIKKANRKATKGGKNVWRKGQSSVYNPSFNKYRLEAKKRSTFGNRGEGNLTEAKLAEHNKLISETQCDDVERMSIGGDTAISAFTNCSLPTFSRLIQNWNSGSLLHKEMIAVLAAVTEVLKTYGGKETETEYFAALMTTLDVVDTDEGITAVICLLAIVVKRLNENVLKLHCDSSCDTFIKLLLKYMNSDHGALLRNLLKVLYAFLKVKTNWTESTCENLKILLEFTVHHKPKVRRAAHQIVRALIVDCVPGSAQIHPGSAVVSKFCISKLESGGGSGCSKDVFYVLSLLEEMLGVLPTSHIKSLCETILRVMTLSNSMVTSGCLKALKGLFDMKPKPENLPSDLNARIITALYDYQPNVKESLSIINWLQLMEVALINLKNLDEKLCIGHLPKFFGTAVKCWLSDKDEVLEVVAYTLKNLLHKCIDSSGEVFQQYLLDDPINNPMHKMFHLVEESLSYQYHQAWRCVLIVLTAFFEVMGKHCYTVMLKCLKSLADMHDSYKFPHISELEKAVGTAIQHMGPKVVLQAIPLQINGDSDKPDFPRSWLLPLLRDNVRKTELQYFVRYFMPLAAKLRNKSRALQQENKVVESKLYDLLCSQVWSLLSGFCNEPVDLKQCFKDIARTLGILLNEEPELRVIVLSSLRILINKNIENEENRSELAKFSKNYLPILFNLYSTETKNKNEETVRLAVYDTCKVYLQISDNELCKTFFKKALDKLLLPETSPFMQQSMIDICRAILPYVDATEINKIYEYCKPLLKDTNHTTQKKAYSVMNAICSCSSESCTSFVKDHLEDIGPLLCDSVSGLKPSTRALRLNILGHLATQLTENEKDFVISIIPEAVLCTKENSIKARAAAFNLLIVIGNTMLKWQPNDHKGVMCDFMKILLAGLAGSPHLMSATILAIGRVLFEFKDKMDSNLIHMLIENACLLLTSKSREVVVSAISFLKVMFSVLDTADLAQHVEFMVKSITSISEDNQRNFRFKAKELFTKLIRKFGFEMISSMIPESYEKQLRNIRKTEARKARKKNTVVEDNEAKAKTSSEGFDDILADSDEEMLLEDNTENRPKVSHKKMKHAQPMIEEHGEDDIVDFLDPAVNKKLLTVRPEKLTVKKTEKGFPISEDGRLIITEEDEDASASKSKEEKQVDERKEMLTELGALFKKNKKRKHDDSDDEDIGNKTVARGIHRTVESKAKKLPGSEFKAKKAGGDIKKGSIDPYAYVPLNKQFLNKRKQVKMKGQFKNMVKGAKKGASTGVKRKMRDARRKRNK